MLSDKEKEEMLKDSKSKSRRDNFRFAKEKNFTNISFDDYLVFLNNVQKIFAPFEISRRITVTRLNKI